MSFLALIDDVRALVDALADAGNEGAANIVERAADELDRLSEKVADLEDTISELRDEKADLQTELDSRENHQSAAELLAALAPPLDELEQGIRKLRYAVLNPDSDPVPTVRVY